MPLLISYILSSYVIIIRELFSIEPYCRSKKVPSILAFKKLKTLLYTY